MDLRKRPGEAQARRLEELLGRYVEGLLVDGDAPHPAALCAGEPELLEPLREHIREYERLQRTLAPPAAPRPGQMLLHYRIAERLGKGGMGEVYAAQDTRLGRRVALKLLRPETALDESRRRRFLREARIVAALNHPSIVTLFAVEEAGDLLFLAMELVEGKTLRQLIPKNGLALERILDLAGPLTEALAAAHARGVVHRDLKPANVMVTDDGRLKVLDFGIAKLRAGDAGGSGVQTETLQDRLLGTLPYMSPEQVRGDPLDARTDLFSFGVVLYEMATGRRPFSGRGPAELISSILRDEPRPLGRLRDGLPQRLEQIVERCLAKEPGLRFASAAEIRTELEALRRETEAPERGPESPGPWETVTIEMQRPARRLYVASASEDLAAHRAVTFQVLAELGLEALTADPGDGVGERERRIAEADALVVLLGWSRGPVPGPEDGGDALRPYAQWEVHSALRRAKPVLVLAAGESWPGRHWEEDSQARALVRDFRGELGLLAVTFDYEPPEADSATSLPAFRARLKEALERYRDGRPATRGSSDPAGDEGLGLRAWPPPELPERPYPLLLPYSHPDLLAGRDRELAELREALTLPVPIVGLYAPSGAGKSSFLAAGLVAALRAEGRPVAIDRHPEEPGLAARLLGDLLTAGDGGPPAFDDDVRAFVHRLRRVRRQAGTPALLVLDQFEDLLRHRDDGRRSRAAAGALLAATLQRQPGLPGPLCRWILAYRQEYHGQVASWLGDVLREARAEGLAVESLPHDLSGPERFLAWPLPLLGTPPPGSADRAGEAARLFRQAIEKPLALRRDDGTPHYPWSFAAGGAARLAAAFAKERLARPRSPLLPELQVTLAHLLAEAAPSDDGPALVEVGEEPGELLSEALEEHLVRALDAAFPVGRTTSTAARTRALLALRELADATGRRSEGAQADVLAQAIGPAQGEDVLEKLATPATRLVVKEERADGFRYVLSHDRLAQLLVRLVDTEGPYGRLGVDAGLVALRRFVTLSTELYLSGEAVQATRVPRRYVRPLRENADVLLWDEERRRWWEACRRRQQSDRRRKTALAAAAVLALLIVTVGAWYGGERLSHRRALYQQLREAGPEAALAALGELFAAGGEPEELRAALGRRQRAMDVVELGLGGIASEERSAAVLQAVELALPFVDERPEDHVLLGNLVWALDYAPGREPAYAERARALRERILAPLRRIRPPPPPAPGNPGWARIPGGTFAMGSLPGEVPVDEEAEKNLAQESPRHSVTLSPFRMLRHEVTNREYRWLVPAHQGADEAPVGNLSWWDAYVYASWLGGRLPTEAEWEYAARAGCRYAYCDREGREASVDQVAWTLRNARGRTEPLPVMQLEPNPWGLYDMYGNFAEWTADWMDTYSAEPQVDPWGPANGFARVSRGGRYWVTSRRARAAFRRAFPPDTRIGQEVGIRVVLPFP